MDGDVIVAGAQLDDGSFTDSGSAYAFQRNEGGTDNWGQIEKILPDDEHTNDNFGISIALDGTTAIVGSYVGDSAVANSGVAYVQTLAGFGPTSFGTGGFDTLGSSDPAQESNVPENGTGLFRAFRALADGGTAAGSSALPQISDAWHFAKAAYGLDQIMHEWGVPGDELFDHSVLVETLDLAERAFHDALLDLGI